MANLDACENFLRLNKLIYWRIFNVEKDKIFCYPSSDALEEKPNLKESIEFFRAAVENLPKGLYSVLGRAKYEAKNDELKFPIFLNENNGNNANINGSVNSDVLESFAKMQENNNKILAEFEKEKQKIEFERKLEKQQIEFDKKMAAIKSPAPDRFERLITSFLPIILAKNPAIAGLLGMNTQENFEPEIPKINSQNQESVQGEEQNNQLILNAALTNLADVLGEDFIAVMHRLGLFAKNNPNQFLIFASQLSQISEVKKPENQEVT